MSLWRDALCLYEERRKGHCPMQTRRPLPLPRPLMNWRRVGARGDKPPRKTKSLRLWSQFLVLSSRLLRITIWASDLLIRKSTRVSTSSWICRHGSGLPVDGSLLRLGSLSSSYRTFLSYVTESKPAFTSFHSRHPVTG